MRAAALLLPLLALLPAEAQKSAHLQKSAHFQKKDTRSGYDKSARATTLHNTIVFVSPDDASEKVAEITPGHEMVVTDHNGAWIKVFANTDTPDAGDPDREPEFPSDDRPVPQTGWVKDRGIVTPQTPNGDVILFGAAANLEDLAGEPHPPKGAAQAAHMLYGRVNEYFPDSRMGGEAAWRSADIRWQLEKLDNGSLPSAKEQEAYLRPPLYDGQMKKVIKFYPGTKYAFLAAYDLLDNKLCGDWQGLPKCPEMEANLYLKYAEQYPESPKSPEAFYNAIYRQGVLVSMYTVQEDRKRADAAAQRTQSMAEEMQRRFGGTDYTARAVSIAFRVKQGLSIFGNDRD